MDQRALLATLLKAPRLDPLTMKDSGATLLAKLLSGPAHEVYGKALRPMESEATELTHDIRVGARRLAEALELAEPLLDRGRARRSGRRARRLRQTLGEKRVADVLLADLRALVKEAGIPEPAGLSAFEQRGAEGLKKALRHYPPEKVLRHGLELLNLTGRPRRPELSLIDVAGRHLYRRASEIEPLLPALADPRALETHHRLRIRIKRLRYTLEILAGPAGDALPSREALATLKQHQNLLGRLNDAKDLVLWLHDPELIEVLGEELAAALISRVRIAVDQRWEEAKDAILPTLGPLADQLRRSAGAIDHLVDSRD